MHYVSEAVIEYVIIAIASSCSECSTKKSVFAERDLVAGRRFNTYWYRGR